VPPAKTPARIYLGVAAQGRNPKVMLTPPNGAKQIDAVRAGLERRLLDAMTGIGSPRLYGPPPDTNDRREPVRGIGVWRFPEWFVVQEAAGAAGPEDGAAVPGWPLHSLAHPFPSPVQSLAMRCGYPASSIRERVYADPEGGRFGVLLYTASRMRRVRSAVSSSRRATWSPISIRCAAPASSARTTRSAPSDPHLRIVEWSEGATRVAPISDAPRKALHDHLMGAGELLRSNALDPESLFDHEEKLVQADLFVDFA